ncbi:MAG: N-6 DNA methylase [Saprospiraceae bacterium]|nr:N-6 DNA methylase [Saprospiraceae bacterium]
MQLFEQQIVNMNFSFLESNENSGVLLTNDFINLSLKIASPEILFGLETAKKKFNADAVYFRYFSDGRGNVPQLYLFDFTHKSITTEEKNHIHIQMWNGNQVPAYIIIEKALVSIFDSRKKPNDENEHYARNLLTLTGQTLKDFGAKDFDSGLFWEEQDEKKDFLFEESATRDLIRGLKEVYFDFQKHSKLDKHVALKLLVQSLLIKYLEERDEKSASGYFAGTYFKKYFQCSNFCDTIKAGKLLDLLDQLANDFNGKIFEWNKENEVVQRIAIQQSEVKKLADYLDGKSKNNQYVLWRLYSFSHLPVEVISSVYEELLTDSKDIVYTPEMIVSTLVDECMPLKQPKENFKVIDVSCGSGIFLVKTYKRVVQWWRYNEWKKTGKLTKPPLSLLKELLLNSIYGVDIEQDAIRLSVFSLALAILDEVDLDPPTWELLKFPDLSNNIITQDFFVFITNKPNADFDLVIGNPPFNPPKDNNGITPSNGNYFIGLKNKIGYRSEFKIPDENPALHFLVQSLKLLKKDAVLCLIQPSGPILYQKDQSFKQEIFSQNNLLQLIDFTKLADKLWGKTKVATAAVFIQKTKPDNHDVLHLIANRTFSNTNRLFLEFDHYDFHFVPQKSILSNPFVWKANLLGGGRIHSVLEKYSKMRSVGEFIEVKESSFGWKVGEGFKEKGFNPKPCEYLTNQPFLPSDAFKEGKIERNKIRLCDIQLFYRKGDKKIYKPPHILIKENIGFKRLTVTLLEEYMVFSSNIIGIHAPTNELNELKQLNHYFILNNDLLRFLIKTSSSQLSISKVTVPLKEDFMNLPYPENLETLTLTKIDKILIYETLSDISNLTNVVANEINLIEYADTFCETLNSIYGSEKEFQLYKIIDAGKYYALHFEYTSENLTPIQEKIVDLEKYIEEAIPTRDDSQQKIHIQRIIKAYGHDSIILAKPKQLRYWLPSIALRDADETFADYIKSRY